MERHEYPAMLASLAPHQAVEVLNNRVSHVGKLNTEIAEWLAERRRLEEAYANGLRKLARRPIQGVDLGIFSIPWSSLTNATNSQADSHASLASKIDVDVERPLRDFTKTSREMQAIASMQGNVGALARDVEQAQSKIDRLQGRAERADTSKISQAHQELDQAQSQWESQAPYVFENLQALDETRLNHLRDVLTQLQTHEVDQVERDRVSAEQCLNALLNVEVADEIKTFQLKAIAGKSRSERPSRQTTGLLASPSSSATTQRLSLAPTLSNDTGSVQETEKKGPLKGLKRFSTVMGRKKDRNSKLPSQLEPMSEVPETKTRSFGGFGRKKREASIPEVVPESNVPPRRPYSPTRIGSEAFEPSGLREMTYDEPAATAGHINGDAGHPPEVTPSLLNGGHQSDLADLEAPRLIQQRNESLPQQDNEGFSVPQSDVDPITLAQLEAAASGDGVAPQYNVNIRDAPIADERNVDPDAALVSMASKLQMQAPPPQRRAGTVRGRRDGRHSAFISGFELPPSMEPPVPNNEIAKTARALDPGSSETPFTSNASFDPSARALDSGTSETPFSSSTAFDPPARALGPGSSETHFSSNAASNPSTSTSSAFAPSTGTAAPVHTMWTSTNDAFDPSASTSSAFNPSASSSSAFDSSATTTSAFNPSASTTSAFNASASTTSAFNPSASTASTFSTLPHSQEPASSFNPAQRAVTTDTTGDNQSVRSGRSLASTTSQGHRHPDLTSIGLNVSIVENVNALFENGKVVSSSLLGEVAMAYNSPGSITASSHDTIRLSNFAALEKVAPNPAFVNASSTGRESDYVVNLASISKTQVAFKYQARLDDTTAHAPLVLTTAFKVEPTQVSVIVSYALNPAFVHTAETLHLSNVMLGLTLEGAKATQCLSKPVGTFSREKNLIFWQLGDITLPRGAAPVKLLARFSTESEATSGNVEARWEIVGDQTASLGSGLAITSSVTDGSDPFADEGANFKAVHTVRKLASGNYSAR